MTTCSDARNLPTMRQLGNAHVATRMAKVRYEDGSTDTIPVVRYRIVNDEALKVGTSRRAAIRAAKYATDPASSPRENAFTRTGLAAVVQTRSGAYWIAPVRGREAGGLGDDQRTERLWTKRTNDALSGWVERRPPMFEATVRRWC